MKNTVTRDNIGAVRSVYLVPLDPPRHADAIYQGTHGPERDDLWRFLRNGPFATAEGHRNHIEELCGSGRFKGLAVVETATAAVMGQAGFIRVDAEHRSAELAYVLFLPAMQRSRGGTEAFYLLLRYAFDILGVKRLEWRCDSRNARSEQAALRLGFSREGLMRQHMVVKGESRDTLVFSLLRAEWRSLRPVFEEWLSAENFGSDGRAKDRLERIRDRNVLQALSR